MRVTTVTATDTLQWEKTERYSTCLSATIVIAIWAATFFAIGTCSYFGLLPNGDMTAMFVSGGVMTAFAISGLLATATQIKQIQPPQD